MSNSYIRDNIALGSNNTQVVIRAQGAISRGCDNSVLGVIITQGGINAQYVITKIVLISSRVIITPRASITPRTF